MAENTPYNSRKVSRHIGLFAPQTDIARYADLLIAAARMIER